MNNPLAFVYCLKRLVGGPHRVIPARRDDGGKHRWTFRLAALLAPVLLLALVEAGLRLGGYGHPTSFFIPRRVGGADMLINNDAFVLSFFPPEKSRLPLPFVMEAAKAPGAIRIFVLGESAAAGDPDPAYGAARFLDALLRERFPAEKFEVINTSITANNSHGILPIARECARHDGDFWIIYMGNNEMVGPFGAATALGARAVPWPLVRLNLAVQRWRLGQLMTATMHRLAAGKSDASWGTLEMFLSNRIAPDDPRKEVVYRNFARNLRDILRAGLDSDAQIIVNKMAVNLADCPPLASMPSAHVPPAEYARCDQLMADGSKAASAGNFGAAAALFQQAAGIDPQRAIVQYEWAEALARGGHDADARAHYQLACDNDALPARADSRINGLIDQAAGEAASPRLALLDAPAILSSNNPTGLCGAETFYEHVHFNEDGNYRLARAWAEEIERRLPGEVRRKGAPQWASQEICEQRLGLSDWNRWSDLVEILDRRRHPPLNQQSNNARQIQRLEQQLGQLRARMDHQSALDANQMFNDAIARAPGDADLYSDYADFLEAVGALDQAIAQWSRVAELWPQHSTAYFQKGRLLERVGRLDEARAAFWACVQLRPAMAPAWAELSNIDASQGRLNSAWPEMESALRWQPREPALCVCAARLLSRMERHDEALGYYRKAVDIAPEYIDGRLALGGELAADGKRDEARKEFEAVLGLDPTNALARAGIRQLEGR